MGVSQVAPLFLPLTTVARRLQVSRKTLWRWVSSGAIKAVSVRATVQWGEKERRTTRGRWLIPISEVRRLLEAAYCGEPVPPSILRAIERLARPLPK